MKGKKKESNATEPEDPAGEQDPNGGEVEFTQPQQDFIDKLAGRIRQEARDKARQDVQVEMEAKQKEANEAAEAERLKKQAEWQKLAEQREAKIQELDQEKKALEEAARTMHVRRSVEAKAVELEFEHPFDAYNLLLVEGKLSEVEVAEDGATTGFETALEELAKSGRLPMKKEGGSGLGTPRRLASRPAPATSPQVPERPLAKL